MAIKPHGGPLVKSNGGPQGRCLGIQGTMMSFNNRPFYSCVFSDLALDCKRGWG